MKLIELIVSPTGDTKLETRGFAGSECRQASAFLEQALGLKSSDRPTAASFQTQSEAARLQEGRSS
jgi:hypothetical protein